MWRKELKKGNETILRRREVEAKVWRYRPVKRGRVHLTISGWLCPSQEYAHWATVQGKCIKCLYVPGIVLGSRNTTKDKKDMNKMDKTDKMLREFTTQWGTQTKK